MSDARETLDELIARTGALSDAELDDFWTTLQPATIDFMIGEWKVLPNQLSRSMNPFAL